VVTGTGAAPVIAQLAKERDILTVGIVTIPFNLKESTSRTSFARVENCVNK
jgi:cell division GTPase FtsZ